jgi:hypothetical protein
MKWTITSAAVALLVLANAAIAETTPELLIYGGEGRRAFLGCLNCDKADPNSVWNDNSRYSFKNGYSVWNRFRPFLRPHGAWSACNSWAKFPPVIVDRDNHSYGHFTVNVDSAGSVCGAAGSKQVCEAVHDLCASANVYTLPTPQ